MARPCFQASSCMVNQVRNGKDTCRRRHKVSPCGWHRWMHNSQRLRLYSARVRGDAWICAATLGLTDSWLQIGLCSEGRNIDGYVIAEMNFKFKSDENKPSAAAHGSWHHCQNAMQGPWTATRVAQLVQAINTSSSAAFFLVRSPAGSLDLRDFLALVMGDCL